MQNFEFSLEAINDLLLTMPLPVAAVLVLIWTVGFFTAIFISMRVKKPSNWIVAFVMVTCFGGLPGCVAILLRFVLTASVE